jgi:hypothetical protein
MLNFKTFDIEDGNFGQSARRACIDSFNELGRMPNEIWVNKIEGVVYPQKIVVPIGLQNYVIPVVEKDHLMISFGIREDQAMLDTCDPSSPFETFTM